MRDDPVLHEISLWAREYVDELETKPSDTTCLCEWLYRDPKPEKGQEEILGPRMRVRSHEHPECPVHTKRGFLIGFYQWLREKKLWSVAFTMEREYVAETEKAIDKQIRGNDTGEPLGLLNDKD